MSSATRPVRTVTIVGDRIPDLDLPRERRDEAASGWVRRLDHLLALHLPTPVSVTDASEAGMTIHKVRERWFDDVLMPAPEVVLVHVGLSDAWGFSAGNNGQAKDAATCVALLAELVALSRARNPATRIILVEPVLTSIDESVQRTGPVRTALLGYRSALQAFAQAEGLAWLPAGSLVDAAKRRRDDDEWLGAEAIGLDTVGSLLLADAALRVIAGLPAAAGTALGDGQTFLLIGDSITDADRRFQGKPMGRGYARLLQGLQVAREPTKPVQFINRGIGGDTAIDIEARWQRDALAHRPDWLLLYTGINDYNSRFGRPVTVTPELYRASLARCLQRARTAHPGLGLVVVGPFMLTRDALPGSYRSDVRAGLPAFTAAAAALAREFGARFVDLQAVMDPLMARFGNRVLGTQLGADVVHPSELACLAIAEAVYEALAER